MGRRRITIGDLRRIRTITSLHAAPDGRCAVFTVRTAHPEKPMQVSHLWWVVDGNSRQLTFGEVEDGCARISPDGTRIAFVRRVGEEAQIRILSMEGGESEPITRLGPGSVSALAWSPDSRRIAFVYRKTPEFPDNRKAPRVPIAREIRRLDYRTEGVGFQDGEYAHVWTVCIESREAKQLTDGDWNDAAPAWSPDGQRIAFCSNRREDRDLVPNDIDLWTVPAEGGRPEKIETVPGPVALPGWSPDGRWIAYIGHDRPEESWGTRNPHLWVVRAEGGGTRDLMPEYDRPVGNMTITDTRPAFSGGDPPIWAPDGRNLFVVTSDRGTCQLCRVPFEGGAVERLTEGRHEIFGVSADRRAERFALAIGTALSPGEVHWFEPGGPPVKAGGLNDDLLSELELTAPERLEFRGKDGTELSGWILKPPAFDPSKKYPLLLEIHGGPRAQYGEGFFHEFHVLAAEGYVVLYANPRGSQGYGEAHARAIVGDWGRLDYEDLMAAVDHVVSMGFVDEKRMGVIGGSYGGYMTAWILGHTDRFAAGVAMRGLYNAVSFFGTSDIGPHLDDEFRALPWEDPGKLWRHSPVAFADRIRTPLLILHSEGDLRCPIEQAEQLFACLKRLGRDVEFVRFPEENHDLSRAGRPDRREERLRRIVDWFRRKLGTG